MSLNADTEPPVVIDRSEIQYAGFTSCSAYRCTERAQWVITERTPFNRRLGRTMGSITVLCDDHITEAQVADRDVVEGNAAHQPVMILYRALAEAWPQPVKLT